MKSLIEVFTNCYGPFGVSAAIEGCAKAGVTHIELAMKGHDMGGLHVPEETIIGEDTPPERLAAFKQALTHFGVHVITANGGDDIREQEGVERVRRRLKLARELGARYFVLSVGHKSQAVFDHLLELAEEALKLGIVLALETHPPLVTNAAEGLATMRALRHRNIGINYDTANVYYYNRVIDTVAEIEALLDHIVHVHLKDSRKGFEDWYFPAIGKGTIDIPGVFKALNAAGYYGPFSLELEGIQGEGELPLEARQQRIVDSMAYLRKIGVTA